jgi:hypothetical protein
MGGYPESKEGNIDEIKKNAWPVFCRHGCVFSPTDISKVSLSLSLSTLGTA